MDSSAYLEEQKVKALLQNAVAKLLLEKPPDAAKFFCEHFRNIVDMGNCCSSNDSNDSNDSGSAKPEKRSSGSLSEILGDNESILAPEELEAAKLLVKIGQTHLFSAWPAKGTQDDGKKKLLQQVIELEKTVAGGLGGYVERAKELLLASRDGVNPYDGFVPKVPAGERLSSDTPENLAAFEKMETTGAKEFANAAFVMVAGGLGERLGYNGIKINLPTELTTQTKYIALYVNSILAMQEQARAETGKADLILPLCIMTSGDTDGKTRALLAENKNFGMADGQLTIVKQEKVPALTNNDAHFALDSPFEIETKPHGHGDVHELLFSSGTIKSWVDSGKSWVVFFQDTNGMVFRALPAALGVSKSMGLSVNSFTVPRRPGEAVGAICRLEGAKKSLTINVEYNQIVPLMQAAGLSEPTEGFSPFPGNINVLVFEASGYLKILEQTKGIIAEFVNPKYSDAAKTTFKKPTRLECMMQDYPKLLGEESKVGFTQLERWTSFSAVKNNIVDAAGKQRDTGFAESGATGEADMYYANRKFLAFAGVDVAVDGDKKKFADIEVDCGAKCVLAPNFGTTLAGIKAHLPGGAAIKISKASTFVVDGSGVSFESMDLDGALIIKAVAGAKVVVKDLKVKNAGWQFCDLPENAPEELAIRGYNLDRKESVTITVDKAGEHVLSGEIAAGVYTLSGSTLAK
jgi:UDP-sugar pyrophosphorylase